jgi:hypothetical protein
MSNTFGTDISAEHEGATLSGFILYDEFDSGLRFTSP